MRKMLITLLTISTGSVFAVNNGAFQEFDNQYNAGLGVNNITLYNGGNQQSLSQSQYMSLDVERLFDLGIWFDINANLVLSQNNLGTQASGTGMASSDVDNYPGMPASQDPNLGGVNAKIGYAFPILPERLQVTPYGLVGRNTNLSMSTIVSNNFNNVTNDFYYTGGVGTRIEYRINKNILVYGDQLAAYNWDQSAPIGGITPQNNMVWTSTVGAKFNPYKSLQLGLQGFYTNYQAQASPPSATPTNNGGSSATGGLYTIYQPQSSIGAQISIGLTY
jgi:hypothetical protein